MSVQLSVLEHQQLKDAIATVRAGVYARQVGTGGWRLVGPLAPLTPTSIGRFRTERKALEQQVAYALVRLLNWETHGEKHYEALRRIQRKLNAFKNELPTLEDLLIEQLQVEGFQVA